MQWLLAYHGADHAQIVGTTANMGKQIAHPQATLATLAKIPRTGHPTAIGTALGFFRNRQFANLLALKTRQRRFEIKRVDVAGASIHETENNILGPCRSMGQRSGRGPLSKKILLSKKIPLSKEILSGKEPSQGQQAKSARRVAQKVATGKWRQRSALLAPLATLTLMIKLRGFKIMHDC
jgi:hypothetical protein